MGLSFDVLYKPIFFLSQEPRTEHKVLMEVKNRCFYLQIDDDEDGDGEARAESDFHHI